MLTFEMLLKLHDIDPVGVRMVRHGDKELPILQTFQNEPVRFKQYQSFQTPNKFGNAEAIAVFAPGSGTSALFLGLWDIKGYEEGSTEKNFQIVQDYNLPKYWNLNEGVWYDLQLNPVLQDLSERLVIEWGGSTVAWVQKKTDKEILEIKMKSSLGDFISYDSVQLTHEELKLLCSKQFANATWLNAMSAVNGIYLIRDVKSKKLYIGSAYGEKGILGRWSAYAQNGHGGNQELKNLNPKYFEYSILEILSGTLSAKEVIQREKRWKERLGTRDGGLNLN